MDNSWDYNGGASEIPMGKALRDRYRDKAFRMTKIDGRSKKEFVQGGEYYRFAIASTTTFAAAIKCCAKAAYPIGQQVLMIAKSI